MEDDGASNGVPDLPAGTDLDVLVGERPTSQRRGRLRRRLRHLRRVRELLMRDLGGLMFEIHRSGEQTDRAHALVEEKLGRLSTVDAELRELADDPRRPPRHRPARARDRRHLPAVRRAARQRRALLLGVRDAGRARRGPAGGVDGRASPRSPRRREPDTAETEPDERWTPRSSRRRPRSERHREPPPTTDCPRCGAPLRPDQDWCLNCGTAVTTEVAGAPGWRTPVAIVAAVLLLAAGALVFAFLQISDDAEREAQAPAPTAAPATPPAATTPTPTATPTPAASASPVPTPPTTPVPGSTPGASPTPGDSATPAPGAGTVGTWPEGEDAWTIVLFSSTRQAEADDKAKGYADQGKSVGVLKSDDYSSLRPGYWVVFSGQYETQEEAQSAAEGFGADAPGAYARQVTPK